MLVCNWRCRDGRRGFPLFDRLDISVCKNESQLPSYLAHLTPPDEVCLSPAPAHVVHLLIFPLAMRRRMRRALSHTNRLTLTQFGWTSLQDVHCTLKVYQNGSSGVSSGRKSVTLRSCKHVKEGLADRNSYPERSPVKIRESMFPDNK